MDQKNLTVHQVLEKVRLLPLYTATDLSLLPAVEEALVAADVPLIEVTYRSDLANEAIKALSASKRLIVGAGTVKNLAQAQAAVKNGAQFIVSPALVPEVIEYCLTENIPVFPGVATPGEIQKAYELGLRCVKFFPADIYGGLKAIKALRGPYFEMSFVPTGGVNQENYQEYLAVEGILAVGGSFILSEDQIRHDSKKATTALKNLVSGIN